MRSERFPNQGYARHPVVHEQCHHTIRLDGKAYKCERSMLHGGMHDAFEIHGDGGLVIW